MKKTCESCSLQISISLGRRTPKRGSRYAPCAQSLSKPKRDRHGTSTWNRARLEFCAQVLTPGRAQDEIVGHLPIDTTASLALLTQLVESVSVASALLLCRKRRAPQRFVSSRTSHLIGTRRLCAQAKPHLIVFTGDILDGRGAWPDKDAFLDAFRLVVGPTRATRIPRRASCPRAQSLQLSSARRLQERSAAPPGHSSLGTTTTTRRRGRAQTSCACSRCPAACSAARPASTTRSPSAARARGRACGCFSSTPGATTRSLRLRNAPAPGTRPLLPWP
jgi:hypothetical protein